jgi:hypothetical protein
LEASKQHWEAMQRHMPAQTLLNTMYRQLFGRDWPVRLLGLILTRFLCPTLQELEASSSDDEEPGGLHIGGIVIRAPSRSRAAQQHGRNPSRGPAAAPGSSSRAAGTRNQPQQLQQEELERLFASEDSLDDEMRDYLDNVKQVRLALHCTYLMTLIRLQVYHHQALASGASCIAIS